MSEIIRITTTAERAAALAEAAEAYPATLPGLAEATAEVREALGQPERKRRYAQTLLDMGHPAPQRPERSEGGMHDDYRETHPAYAMIGASRVNSSGTALAGSDFDHHAYMTISIRRADLNRGLSSDRWHAGRDEIVEVALSEAQWATFLSATNIGDGVPCTLRWTETDGHLPGIVPITNRREQVNSEVRQTLADAVARLDAIIADPKVTKAVRTGVSMARQELASNLPFVIRRADEYVETTIERAKIEVEAYLTGAIQRAGITALGGEPPIRLIEPGGHDA